VKRLRTSQPLLRRQVPEWLMKRSRKGPHLVLLSTACGSSEEIQQPYIIPHPRGEKKYRMLFCCAMAHLR
jgi:hypothetical protein